jgi:streptomycin 6-kinase
MALNGKDEEATNILAGVIKQMSLRESPKVCATIQDWAKGFERYLATGEDQIPMELVEDAHQLYLDLGATQRRPTLLHGDLQHYNVLFDAERGWLAIDPKGVIGEIEYELGAVLRNPFARPELFTSRATIERRLNQFANILDVDIGRALAWAFAQAVLSAIWEIENGFAVNATTPSLRLANAIRPMLHAHSGKGEHVST